MMMEHSAQDKVALENLYFLINPPTIVIVVEDKMTNDKETRNF